MNALELKVPPVALVLILGAAMWLAADGVPALAFSLPWRGVFALALTGAGLIVGLAGVAEFRRARTTVNPTRREFFA
jgi:hypothetical protein